MNEDCLIMIGYMEADFVPEKEWPGFGDDNLMIGGKSDDHLCFST